MPFRVIQPPSDQTQFTAEGKRWYEAAKALGIELDAEGFLYSWVEGVRVVVEEVDSEIKGFIMLAAGKRWTHSDSTATILVMETIGDEEGLLEFVKQIASALGATELFKQEKGFKQVGNEKHYTIVGHLLG